MHLNRFNVNETLDDWRYDLKECSVKFAQTFFRAQQLPTIHDESGEIGKLNWKNQSRTGEEHGACNEGRGQARKNDRLPAGEATLVDDYTCRCLPARECLQVHANSQQGKNQSKVFMIAELQRAKTIWPLGATMNFGCIVRVKCLHEYGKAVRRKDVGHKAKDAQALLQI
jgi:hypothetical protein